MKNIILNAIRYMKNKTLKKILDISEIYIYIYIYIYIPIKEIKVSNIDIYRTKLNIGCRLSYMKNIIPNVIRYMGKKFKKNIGYRLP